jgi:exonuclease III
MDRRKLSGPFDRMLGFVVRLIVGIEQRERQGVLVGDLNISHKGIDKYWKNRSILVDDILQDPDEA